MITDAFLNKQAELRRLIQSGCGCRLGETAVCSRKIHTIDPSCPEVITVVTNSDAGQVFYHRQRTGEILHIDIFHDVKALDPVPIGAAAKRGIERYTQEISSLVGFDQANQRYQLAHYVDVQTGGGGGRVTGALRYGQKESLKRAHLNHVHISAKLPDQEIAAAFYLVRAVEEAVTNQGVGLRRVELVQHQLSSVGPREDISAYTAFTDSFLRENRTDPLAEDQVYGYQLAAIADILDNLDDLGELAKLLSEVSKTGRNPYRGDMPYHPQSARLHDAWTKLEGYGFVDKVAGRYQLSDEGLELNRRLLKSSRELEAELRKQGQLLARQNIGSGGSLGGLTQERAARRSHTRRVVSRAVGDHIAISETVHSALTRSLSAGRQHWQVTRADLHYERRLERRGIDICLLIDASASMLGKRMKAAKNLAEHLVINSRDRISVVSFQENSVELVIPFTRNRLEIRQSLENIKPGGLTPLAAGLRRATSYIEQVNTRSGLLLLITDGIPTMGERLGDPLRDALDAALDLHRKTNFHLCCIGLQPNRGILRRVAEAAEGSLHVIDELSTQTLLRIADTERDKTQSSELWGRF